MQQNTQVSPETYLSRIAKARQAMKEFGLQAIVLEGGPAMTYFIGVRWGRSERTFAVVMPANGAPAWVAPGLAEAKAASCAFRSRLQIRRCRSVGFPNTVVRVTSD